MTEVPIMDYRQALIHFGGEKEAQEMISLYDEEHFNSLVLRLHKGIMKRDFDEIRTGSYLLFGTTSYLAARRLQNIARELRRKGEAKEPMDLILKDYMELLDIARELKREMAKYLKRPVSLDIVDFDIFEKQVKAGFPEYFPDANVSPICHGCNIF